MNLQEFHSLVSTSLRRGTTLDNVIPSFSKIAALFLERNYSFKYMENFRLLQLISGDRTVNLPTNKLIKGIVMIRLIDEEGGYIELKKGVAKDFKATLVKAPTGYWVSGIKTIVFNNTPDEDLTGEAIFTEFNDWPTDPAGTHPLMDYGPDVLLYQTLIHMAAYLRDAEMVAAYKALRDEGITTLLLSEDETRWQGETQSMAYRPFHTQ